MKQPPPPSGRTALFRERIHDTSRIILIKVESSDGRAWFSTKYFWSCDYSLDYDNRMYQMLQLEHIPVQLLMNLILLFPIYVIYLFNGFIPQTHAMLTIT